MNPGLSLCENHWQRLKQAIDDRGLSHLVAKNGQEAARRTAASTVENVPSVANFDPLMSSYLMIIHHSIEASGLEVLQVPEDESRCAICFLKEEHKKTCQNPNCGQDFDKWIDYAADGAKQDYERLTKQ
jgi:hypothetical protein